MFFSNPEKVIDTTIRGRIFHSAFYKVCLAISTIFCYHINHA